MRTVKIEMDEKTGVIKTDVHASFKEILIMTGTLINGYARKLCIDAGHPEAVGENLALIAADLAGYIITGDTKIISARVKR